MQEGRSGGAWGGAEVACGEEDWWRVQEGDEQRRVERLSSGVLVACIER